MTPQTQHARVYTELSGAEDDMFYGLVGALPDQRQVQTVLDTAQDSQAEKAALRRLVETYAEGDKAPPVVKRVYGIWRSMRTEVQTKAFQEWQRKSERRQQARRRRLVSAPAVLSLLFVLCLLVPAVAFAVDLGSLEELTTNQPSRSWTSEPLYGADRTLADAYAQERHDLNQYQAERAADIQRPLTYGEPSYTPTVKSYGVYGADGSMKVCQQTTQNVYCY